VQSSTSARRTVRAPAGIGVARASGAARIRAGGVEKDVTIEEADGAVHDAVDEAYRSKYGRTSRIVDGNTKRKPRPARCASSRAPSVGHLASCEAAPVARSGAPVTLWEREPCLIATSAGVGTTSRGG
jgi:hypothetical protein